MSKSDKEIKLDESVKNEISWALFNKSTVGLERVYDDWLDSFIFGLKSKNMLDEYLHDLRNPEWREAETDVHSIIEVSQIGRLRDPLTKKEYKKYYSVSPDGKRTYPYIYGKDFIQPIHRVIARAFIDKPDSPEFLEVNHIDGDKWNSWYRNLEWVTRSGNVRHAIKMGLIPTGEYHQNAVYSDKTVEDVCKALHAHPDWSYEMIGDSIGIPWGYVSRIYKGNFRKDIVDKYLPFPERDTNYLRAHWGEDNTNTAATSDEVHQICQILQDHPEIPFKEIGGMYGLSENTVGDIYRGSTWKQISSQYHFPSRETTHLHGAKGEDNPNCIHTEEQIRQICEILKNEPKTSYPEISKRTGVSVDAIGGVYKGNEWKYISKDYMPFPPRDTHVSLQGDDNPNTKFDDQSIVKVCESLNAEYLSHGKVTKAKMREIANAVGVTQSAVEMVYYHITRTSVSNNYDFIKDRY